MQQGLMQESIFDKPFAPVEKKLRARADAGKFATMCFHCVPLKTGCILIFVYFILRMLMNAVPIAWTIASGQASTTGWQTCQYDPGTPCERPPCALELAARAFSLHGQFKSFWRDRPVRPRPPVPGVLHDRGCGLHSSGT